MACSVHDHLKAGSAFVALVDEAIAEVESAYLHEAVPSDHFQLALQRENRRLPGFRRFGGQALNY